VIIKRRNKPKQTQKKSMSININKQKALAQYRNLAKKTKKNMFGV